MINIALRTEFSFKKTLGAISEIHNHTNGEMQIGVADLNVTFGHIKLEKICKEKDLNPIYGVRLQVVPDANLKIRGKFGPIYIFIAKNTDGLVELNGLVKSAWDNFYYKPMLPMSRMLNCSDNLFVICDNPLTEDRLDYLALTNMTPECVIGCAPPVFVNNNSYSEAWDKETYELFCGARKHGDGFRYMFDDQTYPMHILKHDAFRVMFRGKSEKFLQEAFGNTYIIGSQCDAELQTAPMVRYHSDFDLMRMCKEGALKLKIKLNDEYKKRLNRELKLIHDKDFADYFAIVAEMTQKAKKKMLVGPARGSSAGSLVCYLLGITTVDPIEHGLIFERFIDINRPDLPDIDIDFPDNKRQYVIKDLFKTYGSDNVFHISNINTLGAKSALDAFVMSLSIPKYKVEQLKDSIVDRSGGDARAAVAVADTLDTTEIGKEFIKEYPKMELVKKAEGHATHTGKHAAGIIVCNDDLVEYCGVNSREDTIMMDKHDAEAKNLLKIDCLGLRTLSILEEAIVMTGNKNDFYYKLPVDDEETFAIFNEMRISGIFQFEGQAMQMLCRQMVVENFNDIVAITALARPGPLHSGAANTYVKRRTGVEDVAYVSDHESYINSTKDTMGVIVYQEQLMTICREFANMSWSDVTSIRKAASKSLGKDFFNKYRGKFISGALDNGTSEEIAIEVWEDMLTFGSWGMNKSHSVSYGYISYWCAYMKAHHPIEFTVATLNHARTESSAIKILRDATENDGLEYISVDADASDVKWTVTDDGKMLGGLTNIKGIADKKAKDIIKKRKNGEKLPPGLIKKLIEPETPYDILYPTEHYWGDIYKNPAEYGLKKSPSLISDIITDVDGEFTIIGMVIDKDLRDLNEYNEIVKRGGEVYEKNNLFLRLVVEDDTNQIMCKINRFDFQKLDGQYYSETLITDKSWVIVKGKVSKGWNILNIDAIFDLAELEME